MVLLETVQVEGMWTLEGPTDRACKFLKDRGEPLSSSEKTIFLLAWDLWNQRGKMEFHRLFNLDSEHLFMVASFLVAMAQGAEDLERWIRVEEGASEDGNIERPCLGS